MEFTCVLLCVIAVAKSAVMFVFVMDGVLCGQLNKSLLTGAISVPLLLKSMWACEV